MSYTPEKEKQILLNVRLDIARAEEYMSDTRYMEALIKLENAAKELEKLLR